MRSISLISFVKKLNALSEPGRICHLYMPKLTVKSPEFAGQVFDLHQPSVTIGRGDDNTYPLPHPSVSTQHAELKLEGGDYRLVDLGSTNGTRVNDEKVTETVLRNGDVVMLGNMIMAYQSDVAVAAAPVPAPDTRVNLQASGAPAGRPGSFKNLAAFPKPKKTAGGGFPPILIVGFLVTLAGFGFLAFKLFFS
jgi:hypothetical protein